MSLVSGWFPPTLVVLTVLALLLCVPWEARARWRVLGRSLGVTGAVVGVLAVLVDGFGLIAYPFPGSWYAWFGLVLLGPVVGVVGRRSLRWRRALPPVAFGLAAVMMLTLVNANYQYFPTLRSLFGTPFTRVASIAQVHSEFDGDRREHRGTVHGAVVAVDIPGTTSGFTARGAYVWVPPALVADPTLTLPVLELLAGSPGSPEDWLRGGNADLTADAFAAAHDGRAPLIVMPDANGSDTADTECVDSHRGRAETYLTVDVPAFLHARFHTDATGLGIAGLSEGGTCAVVLALRHPTLYRAFGDYSGLAAPTVGDVVAVRATTHALFDGSSLQYRAHDPATLLAEHRYPDLGGWFEVGAADPDPLHAQQELASAAERSGVDTCASVQPGGHDFTFWTLAFRASLPYLSWRVGATPEPVGLAGRCR